MALQLLDTDYGRAGKARANERLPVAAGYECGLRDPQAWDHIGAEMRRDAPPVRIVRRGIYRPIWTRVLDSISSLIGSRP